MIVADLIYGWEPKTVYVQGDLTRGQAKAFVAYELGEAFIDLRCRKVWLHEREITEDEAGRVWLDDWQPGYVGWIGCARGDEGSEAFWEVDYSGPRAGRQHGGTAAGGGTA